MAACFKCGHELPDRETIFRTSICEKCGSDLRVCKNCGFYLPGAHWDCRETIPEAVHDKERANFCEYYRPITGPSTEGREDDGSSDNKERRARDQLDTLFGDP